MGLERGFSFTYATDAAIIGAPLVAEGGTKDPFEKISLGTSVTNFSGREHGKPLNELIQWISPFLGKATSIVAFQDISVTDAQAGLVPTGTVIEFNANKHHDWLRHVAGADMSCGMLYGFFDKTITRAEFQKDQSSLDELYSFMVEHSAEARLGGGNHFLDFIVSDGRVGFIIHTGSRGNLQNVLSGKVDDIEEYFRYYETVRQSAIDNRATMAHWIQQQYGKATTVDTIHNSIDFDRPTGKAVIFKGAVQAFKEPSRRQKLILPASMTDDILIFQAGDGVFQHAHGGVPHGGGRALSHGDLRKKMADLVHFYGTAHGTGRVGTNELIVTDGDDLWKVLVPRQLEILGIRATETPGAYHSLARSLALMEKHDLIAPNFTRAHVIGYVGHIENSEDE